MHVPVLLKEVIENLKCGAGKTFVDCTLGYGGHAKEILKSIGPEGLLIGFDQDGEALEFTKKTLGKHNNNILFFNSNFRNIKKNLLRKNILSVDGILIDLGVSSRQLEDANRGFSFLIDGPIDMRMGKNIKTNAYDIINFSSEEKIKNILYRYGEEKWAPRIAKYIVEAREKKEISYTCHLAKIISSAIPRRFHPTHIHAATKTFQALRIAVNDELNALRDGIEEAVGILKTKGRICIISFHSLEDRIVKTSFRKISKGCICDPRIPQCVCKKTKRLQIITRKPIMADKAETEINPRARSAKMRVAEKFG